MAACRPGRTRAPHLTATLRGDVERVMPLELFFDLVFVLAITQCSALMAHEPTWSGLAKGLLVLGVLWWSWVGYAWLTSVVDPEEGTVRLRAVRRDGGDAGRGAVRARRRSAMTRLLFACAYGVVRVGAHRAVRARQPRRPRPAPLGGRPRGQHRRSASACCSRRRSPTALLQGALWALALLLDMGGPLVIDARAGSSCRPTSPSATG